MDDDGDVIEHRWTIETRTVRQVKPDGRAFEWRQVRALCSCGDRTTWNRDPHRTRRQQDRHALDGQLANP